MRPIKRSFAPMILRRALSAAQIWDDDLRHGKNASACPFNRWNCTVVPRHAPFEKSRRRSRPGRRSRDARQDQTVGREVSETRPTTLSDS